MTTDVDALSTFLQTGLVTAFVSVVTFFGILVALLVHRRAARAGRLRDPAGADRRHVSSSAGTSVKAYELARERVSVVNADLQESVSGLRIVQAFRRERRGAERFAERSDGYRQARVRGQWLISVYFPFVQLLSSVAAAAVLIVGAGRVDERHAHGGRAGRVPALHRPVLRARAAALPGLRRLPAGDGLARPHPGAAARGADLDRRADEPASSVRRCAARSPSRTCTSATPPPSEACTRKRR